MSSGDWKSINFDDFLHTRPLRETPVTSSSAGENYLLFFKLNVECRSLKSYRELLECAPFFSILTTTFILYSYFHKTNHENSLKKITICSEAQQKYKTRCKPENVNVKPDQCCRFDGNHHFEIFQTQRNESIQ